MKTFFSATIVGALLIASFIVTTHIAPATPYAYGSTLPIAGQTYNLAGSGVSSSATTITLTSLTIKQTGQPIQDSDLGDTFYMTIEPGSNTKQEIISCTTVPTNTGSTITLSGCSRGLSPITPYTASTTLQFTHAGGSQIIFSDPPQLFNQYAALANTQTITGIWTFSTTPQVTNNAVNPTDAVNYSTLLATAISGAGTSTFATMGISQLATSVQVASSTASTSQGRPLEIPSKFSSSTPGVLCTGGVWNCIPVGDLAGHIAQAWLDLTLPFTWSGLQTFNATTTIAASSVAATPIILDGQAYRFPGGQNASSSVLMTDGSGNLSWLPVSRLLYLNTNPTTVTGTTASTTIFSLLVPANTLIGSSTLEFYIPQMTIITNSSGIMLAFQYGNGTTSINNVTNTINTTLAGNLTCTLSLAGISTEKISCTGFFQDPNINNTISLPGSLGNFMFVNIGNTITADPTAAQNVLLVGRTVSSGGSITTPQVVGKLIR